MAITRVSQGSGEGFFGIGAISVQLGFQSDGGPYVPYTGQAGDIFIAFAWGGPGQVVVPGDPWELLVSETGVNPASSFYAWTYIATDLNWNSTFNFGNPSHDSTPRVVVVVYRGADSVFASGFQAFPNDGPDYNILNIVSPSLPSGADGSMLVTGHGVWRGSIPFVGPTFSWSEPPSMSQVWITELANRPTNVLVEEQTVSSGSTGIRMAVATSADGVSSGAAMAVVLGLGETVPESPFSLVVVGNNGIIATSPDAIGWTSRDSVAVFGGSGVYAVEYSPELNITVAGGVAGKLGSSVDGITWTPRTSGFGSVNITSDVTCFCWSPELHLFVMGGHDGKMATSPDGITWTLRTSGMTGFRIQDIVWSSELGLFVAVGSANVGNGNRLATSLTGKEWTVRTTPIISTKNLLGVVWSPELGVFVATSDYIVGSDTKAIKSVDGVNWILVSYVAVTGSSYGAGAWSSPLTLFSFGQVKSSNGTAWTNSALSFRGYGLGGLAWAEDLEMFVLVGGNGQVATSLDGQNWVLRTSGDGFNGTPINPFSTNTLNDIAWVGPYEPSGSLQGWSAGNQPRLHG